MPAETNDTINVFYKEGWSKAWDICEKKPRYIGDNICFSCDDILLARLEVFNYWFGDHPFNNRFHDAMLDMEIQLEEHNIEIHILQEKQKKKVRQIIGCTIGGFVVGSLSGIIAGSVLRN